jgi:ribonucleotide reductase beta subunit family protein with ferritin-like domain
VPESSVRELPRLLQRKTEYTVEYPTALAYAKAQNEIFWLDTEIQVEKDIQDLRVNMTDAENHAVLTVLKLFTQYEVEIGAEYWTQKVFKNFKHPADVQRMANCFSFFELNVHAPFYNQINEAMMINTPEFYNSWQDDSALADRMDFLEQYVASKDLLKSLAVFSMMEGAVLYSSFAFLKHFQTAGKNMLVNVVRGINFSVRDENLHCEAGAWLYRTLRQEYQDAGGYLDYLNGDIESAAVAIYQHECRIIDLIFAKGEIEGIKAIDLRTFVASRLNICLSNLGIEALFTVKENPVAEWFYDSINAVQFHDFFTGTGSEYMRDWAENRFTWEIASE